MKTLLSLGAVFLLGTAAGITLTLMTPPHSGEKTRKALWDGFAETRSRSHQALSDVQARAKGTVENWQTRAQKLAHEISGSAQPAAKKLKAVVTR